MGQFKQGLDYFPFTIGLLKDRKLRKLKVKFGYMVTIVYISLLELIYSDKEIGRASCRERVSA